MRVSIISSLVLFLICWQKAYAATPVVCIKNSCIHVEVVSTPEKLHRGLQGKKFLTEGQGMLFVFPEDDFQSFWMKEMNFPVDMIWIDQHHRIVTIAAQRQPCVKDPCEIYIPTQKSRYVLELPSGFSFKHQYYVGDVVVFKGIR